MKNIIYLDGSWDFRLDADKAGLNQGYFHSSFNDTINLPGTTSQSKKGTPNKEREPNFLTDEYRFEGYAWYRKSFNIKEKNFKNAKLFPKQNISQTHAHAGRKVITNGTL